LNFPAACDPPRRAESRKPQRWEVFGAHMADVNEIAEAMFKLVEETFGKKNLKAGDLTKAMIEKFGAANCSKDDCKLAIRQLIESERCVYSYFGGSYITLPHKEGAAPE
jgi:hypothetical protein